METNSVLALLEQIESQELLTSVIEQLNKDANLSGLETRIDSMLTSKELAIHVYNLLFQLITSDFGSYLNFLYRIDISEKALRSIKDTEQTQIVKQVTLLVLQREWQKVSLRNRIQ